MGGAVAPSVPLLPTRLDGNKYTTFGNYKSHMYELSQLKSIKTDCLYFITLL